jgi:hypothetical protein
MPGIYITAIITSGLALAAVGTMLWQVTQSEDRGLILLLFALTLPLSPATFYGVRKPIDRYLESQLGKESGPLTAVRLWYAPLTEEPAKLAPLLVLLLPQFRGRLTSKAVVAVAMALGLGFALGEIWLVAGFVAGDPKVGKLPFHMYGGFLGERLQTCFIHPGFTVVSVAALARGWRWFPLGLLGSMTLHFLGNFPIYLMKQNVWQLGEQAWGTIVSLWVVAFTVGSLVLLGLIYFGPAAAKKLFTARVLCPDCGERYRQPIFGLNMGMKRYEQCPLCKKWHWIDIRDMLKAE